MEPNNSVTFSSPEAFDEWLEKHGATAAELWVVIFKRASGRQTVTFDQLLEIALCHGWVDVKTKGVDEERYGIRFVPRKQGSNWSETNRALARKLIAGGRMRRAGARLLPADLEP